MNFSEASHQSFTDFPHLFPEILCRWLGIQGSCDPVMVAEAMIDLTAYFLKSYYEDPHAALNLSRYENILTVGSKFATQTPVLFS